MLLKHNKSQKYRLEALEAHIPTIFAIIKVCKIVSVICQMKYHRKILQISEYVERCRPIFIEWNFCLGVKAFAGSLYLFAYVVLPFFLTSRVLLLSAYAFTSLLFEKYSCMFAI